jgi:2-polyprenyl-3-methyl-5-hydroxy-6-metoxy-1,4-benzoquinol methylase
MKTGLAAETEAIDTDERQCRFCRTPLKNIFIDLGVSPLANSYLRAVDLLRSEPFYPLQVYVCANCFLVQLEELGKPGEIFSDYMYFSSFSDSWLEHARHFAEMAIERFGLQHNSRVVEIGSNDGYLLRFFKENGIAVLGVEPADNVARAAVEQGIETLVRFFDSSLAAELAKEGRGADLLVGNNVLAHIPHTNDLMVGLKKLLNPGGVISMEFPHLLSLMLENQFDTIYHEHYSYYSLTTAQKIFKAHGLLIFDAEHLSTHGGSLRIYACHVEDHAKDGKRFGKSKRLSELLKEEAGQGLNNLERYEDFAEQVRAVKREILKYLIAIKEQGKTIAAYGAPAKGNTLLNYCGIGTDFIDYTVDRNPHKQGLYLPGSRIPVFGPEKIFETKPDYLIILPWNLREEVMAQMSAIRQWGGRFVVLIPEVREY